MRNFRKRLLIKHRSSRARRRAQRVRAALGVAAAASAMVASIAQMQAIAAAPGSPEVKACALAHAHVAGVVAVVNAYQHLQEPKA